MSAPATSQDDPAAPPGRGRPSRLTVEIMLVVVGSLALAVAMTWPQAQLLTSTTPMSPVDPQYIAWQLAWASHAAWAQPLHFWTTPAFLQAPDNQVFTDVVLGYVPLGWLTSALTGGGVSSALMLLNLVTMLAGGIAFAGAYTLARVLGSGIPGALLAGAAFGFNGFRLDQMNHANVLSNGGMALAVALMCRGHGWSLREGLRPDRVSPGFTLAGWLVASWQISMGFALGISFGYVLAGVVLLLVAGVLVKLRRRTPWRLLAAHLIGATVFGALTAWLARAFLRMIAAHPEGVRTADLMTVYSPFWHGFLTPPKTSLLFGDHFHAWRADVGMGGQERLVPLGFVLLAVAALGLFVSSWPIRRRLLLAAGAAVSIALAAGTTFPGGGRWTILLLWYHLPGWSAQRTPGRLVIWTILLLCLLAAGAVTRVGEAATAALASPGRRPSTSAALAAGLAVLLTIPAGAALAEGLPNRMLGHPRIAASPVSLSTVPAPILMLPSGKGATDIHDMLLGTEGWPVLANGSSTFEPLATVALRHEVADFPSRGSVAGLRAHGIRTVIMSAQQGRWSRWRAGATRSVAGLGIGRVDHGAYIIFDIPP